MSQTQAETKYVTFLSRRINASFKNSMLPWLVSAYTHPVTMEKVYFKEIPLYRADGELHIVNGVQKLYGKDLDFMTNPTASLRLHEVVHKDVIAAIRDYSECVSTKKSPGVPMVESGRLLEVEEEVWAAKEEAQVQEEFDAADIVSALRAVLTKKSETKPEELYLINQAAALLDIGTKQSEINQVIQINEISKVEPSKVLDLFEPYKRSLAAPKLKQELKNDALIRLAIEHGAITFSNNLFFVGNIELGDNPGRIPEFYTQHLGLIKKKLDEQRNI